MKSLILVAFATTSSLCLASAEILLSDIHSIELKNRRILTGEDVKKLETKESTGKIDVRKIPNLDNIEFKNGMNVSIGQLNDTYAGRMAEGGQDGGGG